MSERSEVDYITPMMKGAKKSGAAGRLSFHDYVCMQNAIVQCVNERPGLVAEVERLQAGILTILATLNRKDVPDMVYADCCKIARAVGVDTDKEPSHGR